MIKLDSLSIEGLQALKTDCEERMIVDDHPDYMLKQLELIKKINVELKSR